MREGNVFQGWILSEVIINNHFIVASPLEWAGLNFHVLCTVIKFMLEQSSSWENDSLPGSQEIPSLIWNSNVCYHVHNSPLLVPILSHVNLVHTLLSCFFKVYFNIVLPPMLRSPKWSSVFFLTRILYTFLISLVYLLNTHNQNNSLCLNCDILVCRPITGLRMRIEII
jgi:hypothetical protein